MAEPFAWAIVGTGTIAHQFASDLARVDGGTLAAVCSRDIAKAEAFRASFGARNAYADLQALLGDPSIDAVYIATPNSLHAAQALQCVAAGKPVLVEKPLAISASEGERILAAAQSGNCFAMEAMWTRFLPATRAAKALIDGGAIGRVTAIRGELSYRHEEDDGRLFRPDLGGGAALDLGVYAVSLTLHLLGRPSTVAGRRRLSNTGVDVRTEFHLGYDGAVARLSCGFDRDGYNRFDIEGTTGVLRIHAPFLRAQRLSLFTRAGFAMARSTGGLGTTLAKVVDRLPFPGHRLNHYPFPGGGLQFEAAAVMQAIRGKVAACDVMPLSDSIAALEIIGSVLADGSDLP